MKFNAAMKFDATRVRIYGSKESFDEYFRNPQ